MLEIDGSYGEGGGQIVRTAVALSSVTRKPIRIRNIRQGRPKPGLAAQHVQAVEALASICNAKTEGVAKGSCEITFEPGYIQGGEYEIDIGTAGSVTLLMQCLMPAMIKAEGPITLKVRGGTDVKWSPPIDYFRYVFLPAIEKFAVEAKLDCLHRGYYPRGGGFVTLKIDPADLQPAHFEHMKPESTKVQIHGISHCSNLPEHVATRQADSASDILNNAGYESKVAVQVIKEESLGSGITLWKGFKGSGSLGERGVRAEEVGRRAAEGLIQELRSTSVVDVYLADQLVPYIALAGGSYTTKEISKHAGTNIWTARHFLDREIKVSEDEVFRIEALR